VADVDRLLETMYAASPLPATAALAAKTLESLGNPAGAAKWRRRTRAHP
jgi:hypothetical protein